MADYNFLLETRLSPDQQSALRSVEGVCRAAGLNLYLSGGPMRDLLSGTPVRMLEITTEGDPTGLAAALRQAGAERMSLPGDGGGIRFHLQGGRMRIVPAQAEGQASTIVEHLRRRGLTLNSIGLSLNPGSRGLPLDPTNGLADIEARLVRMNNPYVFLEKPMMILRAVRLATRLGFAIEERTAVRMAAAREEQYLERATTAARGQELEAIAYEPDPAAVMAALEKEQWLEAGLGKGVRTSKMDLAGLARLGAAVEAWEQLGLIVDVGLVALPLLLGGLPAAEQARLTRCLPSRHLAEWKRTPEQARGFEKKLMAAAAGGASQVQDLIEQTGAEAVVYATVAPRDDRAGHQLQEFLEAARQLRERLPLGVLRAAGLAPRSLQAEAVLRPFFRRLLGGAALSDQELADGLRAAVAQVVQAPAEGAGKPRGKTGRRAGAGPAAVVAVTAAPKAPEKAPAKAPARPQPKPAAKTQPKAAAKPATKAAVQSAAKSTSKAAVKPRRAAKRS